MNNNPILDGVAFGRGRVRVVIANSGDPQEGIVDLGSSDVRGWLAFKTIWFSVPGYQGPFVVRAMRLDGRGLIALQDGAGLAPIVVPPGPTLNGADGWRDVPDGTYVSRPGCFGFQIDTMRSSEIIVVRAVRDK